MSNFFIQENMIIGENPKILVIGDLMIDHYLWGKCERISPEAPVQIVEIERETKVLGGAGNLINNLRALGAKVDVISVIGNDDISDELKKCLNDIKVSSNMLIVQNGRNTTKKTRIMASNQQIVRFDKENKDDINYDSQLAIVNKFKLIIKNYDIVLLSDYAKGMFTDFLTQELIKYANESNIKVLVDPKGDDYSKYSGAYLLTPNKKEASIATKIDIIDDESLLKAIVKLKEDCKLNISLVTLSEGGVAIYDDSLRVYPTLAREVYDVTGAGDTVLASLGFSLACGHEIDKAVKFANLAAGLVVGKIGSSTVSLDEIIEYELILNKASSFTHIKTLQEIELLSKELKLRGKKIVFTNGCFDILHYGHVKYLEEAKSFGDVLILGLNSDESVKRLKGPSRPINNENDRARILTALRVVDYVVIFSSDTPYELIKAIIPNTLVKGGDYEGKDVVGKEIVEEVRIVKFVEGKSTTKIIQKVSCQK